jgi:hypothetical protein
MTPFRTTIDTLDLPPIRWRPGEEFGFAVIEGYQYRSLFGKAANNKTIGYLSNCVLVQIQ